MTLVEFAPGGSQRVQSQLPEQIYFILEGSGFTTLGVETELARSRDCVFTPANADRGLTDLGDTTLRYFSVAAASFGNEELYELWPHGPERQ
jgi:mannose-6-phosphate isomerase-like protein (cupin superfamily)